MNSKMSLKPVIVLIGLGLFVLVSFQNCAKSKGTQDEPQYGLSQNASVQSSDKEASLINMPVCANHYGNLTEGLEIYGNCTIANSSRDFTLTVSDRSSKTDCALKCNDNVVKFAGDRISCTFPGGTSNASIETSKNYCRIVVDEKDVKIDSYALDRASCITQCQTIGKDMDKSLGLRCEWQKRLLYLRPNDKGTAINLGSCAVTAKNTKGVVVANLTYASGTTEESCQNVVAKFKTKYQVDDVTFVFTKADYVTIQ
jgi:hypothetical protein